MKTKITEYEGFICINTEDPSANESFIPSGGSQLGCLIMDSKKLLGVSKEALELLKKVKKSHDAIGDLMSWGDKEKWFFGWLGGAKRILDPENATGDRGYDPNNLQYVGIENETTDEFKVIIMEHKNKT